MVKNLVQKSKQYFLERFLSSCDKDYEDNGLSGHRVPCPYLGLAVLLLPIYTGPHNAFFTTQ